MIYQIGCITLLKCIKGYDESKGKFTNYVCNAIRKEIWKELIIQRNNGYRYSSKLYDVDKIIAKNRNEMSEKELYNLCKKEYPKLDINTFYLMYRGNMCIEEECLNVESNENVEDEVIRNVQVNEFIRIIREELGKEGDKDRKIYIRWIMSKMGMRNESVVDICKEYGVSKQWGWKIIGKVNDRVKDKILSTGRYG